MGPRAKLRQANHHLTRLQGSIARAIKVNTSRIVELNDPVTGDAIWCFNKGPHIPIDIGLKIGDVLQNLRASLDYLAWELVQKSGASITPDQEREIAFPIWEVESKYLSAEGKNLRGVTATAKARVRALQPYCSADKRLLLLRDLTNLDKHRTLPVCFLAVDSVSGRAIDEEDIDKTIFNWGPIEKGLVLARRPPGIQHHFELNLGLAFKEGPAANAGVIPAALLIAKRVEEVLADFESEFR